MFNTATVVGHARQRKRLHLSSMGGGVFIVIYEMFSKSAMLKPVVLLLKHPLWRLNTYITVTCRKWKQNKLVNLAEYLFDEIDICKSNMVSRLILRFCWSLRSLLFVRVMRIFMNCFRFWSLIRMKNRHVSYRLFHLLQYDWKIFSQFVIEIYKTSIMTVKPQLKSIWLTYVWHLIENSNGTLNQTVEC